jgi:predicted TIM-barrel fold metal-dependent hydrolase
MWEASEELEYFFSLGFSEEDNKKMLSENAKRVFKF